jgi:hypothetical protein
VRRITPTLLALFVSFIALHSDNLQAQELAKPEWKYIKFSFGPHGEKDEVYYDAKNIVKTTEGFTQVQLKYLGQYDHDEEKQKRLNELKHNRELNGFPLKDYDRFAYSIMIVEFDCKKKLRRYPGILDFDASDKQIGGQYIEELPWEKIPEESLAKIVFDAVCKSK